MFSRFSSFVFPFIERFSVSTFDVGFAATGFSAADDANVFLIITVIQTDVDAHDAANGKNAKKQEKRPPLSRRTLLTLVLQVVYASTVRVNAR